MKLIKPSSSPNVLRFLVNATSTIALQRPSRSCGLNRVGFLCPVDETALGSDMSIDGELCIFSNWTDDAGRV